MQPKAFLTEKHPNRERQLEGREPLAPPQSPEALPEEDQVLFLLMIAKEMDQLIKLLICLTHLQRKRKTSKINTGALTTLIPIAMLIQP